MVDRIPFPVSVDTFRARVAEVAVERLGADVVNDVYGSEQDAAMPSVVNRLGVPYVLTAPVADVEAFFDRRLPLFTAGQVVLDPGFGFGKDLEANYRTLAGLGRLAQRYPDHVLLAGMSRKSMITRVLGIEADAALNGTTVLNTLALQQGAGILRVHDVAPAFEAVRLVAQLEASQSVGSSANA